MINLQKGVLQPAIEIIGILNNESIDGSAKLELLATKNDAIIEEIDNLTQLAPGIGDILSWVADNEFSDAWEYDNLAKPAAELEYQFWKGVTQGIDTLQDWAKQIIVPTRNLIAELTTDTGLSGDEKRAKLSTLIIGIVDSMASVAVDVIGGFGSIVELWLSTSTAVELKNKLAGFLAEVLYQVYIFFFGKTEVGAVVVA